MQPVAPTWNLGSTTTAKWYVRLFPSLNDIAFLLPMIVLFAKMNGTQLLFADGDTGWHIRTGEWILAHHAVPTKDLFSFTKSGQPWFAWEWGWDVLFAMVHGFAGLAGVGFVTTVLLGLFGLLVYRLSVRVSGNHFMAMAVTALAAEVSSIHWLARPHLVSWIFMLAFLNAIESAQRGSKRALSVLPGLMVPWVNLHCGFVAGLLTLGCYAVGEALTALVETGTSERKFHFAAVWNRSGRYWKCLALCSVATLVNPYGWQLHKHIAAYLTDSELLDKIQEFQSISFHAGPAMQFEAMLVLAAFVVFAKVQQKQLAPVLLICLWAHFALVSARHLPFFMMVAAPPVAALLSAAVRELRTIPIMAAFSEAVSEIGDDLQALELTPRIHLASAAALVVLAALFAVGRSPFAPQFSAESFPAQAMPVLKNYAGSRIFTTEQWADYLIYQMYPIQRSFVDGRSDFYGNEFVKVTQRIASADHEWKALLKQYAIALVVVKPETPLSAVLKLTPGSKVLFDDGKVIVFDTRSIYQQFWGKRDLVTRTASVPRIAQSAFAGSMRSTNPSDKLQKGKTS